MVVRFAEGIPKLHFSVESILSKAHQGEAVSKKSLAFFCGPAYPTQGRDLHLGNPK